MNWTSTALWISRILFACRVSVLSVLAGTLLFLMSTQARDLFADVTFGILPKTLGAWGHWLWFFACLVFVWAFPVHYAARRMLRSDAWMFSCRVRAEIDHRRAAEVRRELKRPIEWIPRLLAAVPFAAVLIGLWKAHARRRPDPGARNGAWRVAGRSWFSRASTSRSARRSSPSCGRAGF